MRKTFYLKLSDQIFKRKIKNRPTAQAYKSAVSPKCWKKIIAFLEKFKIPYSEVWDGDPDEYVQYDGHTTYIATEISSILHDIAHWQLCSPRRRKMPDYGLGSGPESLEYRVELGVSASYAQKEEERVSALGIMYERYLGFSAVDTATLHNWSDPRGGRRPLEADFADTLGWLIKHKYLTPQLKPTFKVRTRPDPPWHLAGKTS